MRFKNLMAGLVFAVMACFAPSLALAQPVPQLTASPEKAMTIAATTSTAIKAQHATASASAERLCSSTSAAVAMDLTVHTSSIGVLALRDPGDEGDGTDNSTDTDGLIALGVDPGDGEGSDGDGRLAA